MPEETRCWNDLATDNARLRAVNAKLVEALKAATAAIDALSDSSVAVECPGFDLYEVQGNALNAIAAAEEQP